MQTPQMQPGISGLNNLYHRELPTRNTLATGSRKIDGTRGWAAATSFRPGCRYFGRYRRIKSHVDRDSLSDGRVAATKLSYKGRKAFRLVPSSQPAKR